MKVMFLFTILGVVLSCMHQSSLGALLVLAPTKMHPLWWTPVLPLLFLLSAFSVGFPMVIVESLIASKSFNKKPELHILAPFSKIITILLGAYAIAKISDLVILGGSFVKNVGGHNPLEPAYFGCKLISGKEIFNQQTLFTLTENGYIIKNSELKGFFNMKEKLKNSKIISKSDINPVIEEIKNVV
jgi:hypothetical protein